MVRTVQNDQEFWGNESPACEFTLSDASDEEVTCSWVTQIYEAADEMASVDVKWSTARRRLSSKTAETRVPAEEAKEMVIPFDVSRHHMRPLYVRAWING